MLGESSREFCAREFDRELWGEKRGRLGDRPSLTAAGARADMIRWLLSEGLEAVHKMLKWVVTQRRQKGASR